MKSIIKIVIGLNLRNLIRKKLKMENKKIIILILPFSGHVNPVLSVARELINRKANVIYYSTDEYRDVILKTGGEYRDYPNFPRAPKDADEEYARKVNEDALGYMIDAAVKVLPGLIEMVMREKPDLLIYDSFALFSKYLIRYLNKRQEEGVLEIPMPKTLLFAQAFVSQENVYPTGKAFEVMQSGADPNFMKTLEAAFMKQTEINQTYKIDVDNIIIFAFNNIEKCVIVSVMPELHPCSDLFNESFKFVGPCLSEIRNQDITDEKLKSILDIFKPMNPLSSINTRNSLSDGNFKLVYVSLGTVFSYDSFIYEEIIDAIKTFDNESLESNSSVKLSQLKVVISLGDISYKTYQNKFGNEGYKLPDNILLLPKAPQLEILQRASIFITHCGMNSTSEAIHYGVPMICLPLKADQPLVAYRVADELRLGIKLDSKTAKANQIRSAIHEMFKDQSYLEKVVEFSKYSRNYNGPVEAADLIENYLK